MIEQAFRIGTFAKIPVRIHWTFAFILVYVIGIGISEGSAWNEIVIHLAFTLSMFFCVVLHEFGHALTAQRFGVKTEDIILLPIGGVARLQHLPEKPKQELIIAIMGPMVNLLIAIFIYMVLFAVHGNETINLFNPETILNLDWKGFLPLLLISNLLLLIFNMIPAFPMDGGRVLRSLISMRTNRLIATKWASRIGQFICILFIGSGIYFSAWTTILIGIFIFFSAGQEYKHVVKEFALKNKTVGQFFRNIMNSFTEYQRIQDVAKEIIHYGTHNFPIIDITGNYVGSVSSTEIIRNYKSNAQLTLKEIMNTQVVFLDINTALSEGVQYLESGIPLVFIHQEHNILGVMDQESINHGLSLGI
ncbi:MAG: site-2 protease family protein [Saprospiraceae bacterium]